MHSDQLQESGRGVNGGFSSAGLWEDRGDPHVQVEGYRGWVAAFRVLSGAQFFSTHPNRNAFFGCPWP